MKKIPINKIHDKNQLEGYIFFAERVKELLAHAADDSFKASALNSRTRALELERLFRHAYDTTQQAKSLIPLLDELRESIRHDLVISEFHYKDILLRMAEEVATGFSAEKPRLLIEAADALKAMNVLLASYYGNAKVILRKNIENKKEKKLISAVAEILVIEIQSLGYSREFIRHISMKKLASPLFQSSSFSIETALNTFFSEFNGEKKDYACIAKCEGEMDASAAKAFGITIVQEAEGFQKIDLLNIGENERSDGSNDPLKKYLVANPVKGFDPFDAREKLYSKLNAHSAVIQFLQHKPNFKFNRVCLVQGIADKLEIRIKEPINAMLLGQTHKNLTTGLREKQIAFFRGFTNLDAKSRSSITSAILYHKEALDSKSIENQLVDLWAALEGFVPQPLDASPRIASVLDYILPAQTLIYAEKKFIYVSDGIAGSGSKANDIVNAVQINGSFNRKVAAIILCPEFKVHLDALLLVLDHSPLLRFRMYSLYESFCTTEKTKEELLRHRIRLERQLRRIYISRNTVMHSATVHSDINMLVQNLHSYLDIMLNAVVKVARNSLGETNINSVLKILNTFEKSYLDALTKNPEKTQPLNSSNFDPVFFGSVNPLLRSINCNS